MKLKLPIPDYTTVSRRAQKLSINIVTSKPEGKIHLILDSTGIKVMGEKEWIKHKHGTKERKIWRKFKKFSIYYLKICLGFSGI